MGRGNVGRPGCEFDILTSRHPDILTSSHPHILTSSHPSEVCAALHDGRAIPAEQLAVAPPEVGRAAPVALLGRLPGGERRRPVSLGFGPGLASTRGVGTHYHSPVTSERWLH